MTKKNKNSAVSTTKVVNMLENLKIERAREKKKLKKKLNKEKKRITSMIMKGHGDYVNTGTGKRIGAHLGGMFGDATESLAGRLFSGSGDYNNITANTLVPSLAAQVTRPLEVSKSGRRGVRVIEREYICDIISSGTANTFSNQTFRINAADTITFPWLSVVAQQFEEYQVNGMIFEFKTTSSSFNAVGQSLGTVIMATDYDAPDAAYTSKMQMENADYANSTSSNVSALHGIECARGETAYPLLFCATNAPSTGDLKTYDLGKFQVATFGISGTSVNLGELWVSYDITFYKKQLEGGQMGLTNQAALIYGNPTGFANTNWLGNSPHVVGTLPLTVSGLTVSFPPNQQDGYFRVDIFLQFGTSVTITSPPISNSNNTGVGALGSNYWTQLATSANLTSDVNLTASTYYINGIFQTTNGQPIVYATSFVHVKGMNAAFTLANLSATAGAYTGAYVMVTQVPSPLIAPINYNTL